MRLRGSVAMEAPRLSIVDHHWASNKRSAMRKTYTDWLKRLRKKSPSQPAAQYAGTNVNEQNTGQERNDSVRNAADPSTYSHSDTSGPPELVGSNENEQKQDISPLIATDPSAHSRSDTSAQISGGQPLAHHSRTGEKECSINQERNADPKGTSNSSACHSPGASAPPASAKGVVQRCFRISDIPLAWDKQITLDALADECSNVSAKVLQLTLYPSTTGRSQVGILTLSGPQTDIDKFAPMSHDNPTRVVTSGEDQITIDRHFYGLTPLNRASDEVVADIVAVTGLAGHAYGSWKHRSGKMWLKDFLSNDLEGRVRIMTFGYNTSLTASSTSTAGMVDFARDLIQQLKTARRRSANRPLFLVGHSLGCILIAKILLTCKLQDQYNDLLDATRLLVFFGAPHAGLRTEELEGMVNDLQVPGSDRMSEILSYLRENSRYLREHKELLVNIWKDQKIISLYEVSQSPTVKKNPETGEWKRNGQLVQLVQEVSSLLFLPNEERIPVERNHSEIAKFESSSDQKYEILLGHIENALMNIGSKV